MTALPTGTVTFLFTDLVTSTRLWEEHPEAMRAALERHDTIVRAAIESHGGYVFSTGGDGFGAAFGRVSDALSAATHAQTALGSEDWPGPIALSVRMGVHTGESAERDGNYFGPVVNKAARLMAVAHGGQVVCSSATADLAGSELPILSLGEHRLRDLAAPLEIFQVGAGVFPPLRTLDTFSCNLPTQLSSFIGREREVAEIAELLGEKRLVTLTGVGGVGKTRLALQVAAEVLQRFKDGAWLCELASVRDPTEVADAVAGVFQVTARPGMSLEDSLVAYLGDQELLLILDNCEHLLRPVAALVTTIEAGCPSVRVLATSREGLSVRGEQMWAVPSLEVPDDASSLEAVEACAAVPLFEDRARGVKPAFVIDGTNAQGVAQVCTRLDGVPLAIELAAARIGAMTPSELARRLDRRFRLLTGGDRVAIERHQTLRATIDWSYELLSDAERQLLIRLSVFAGGFTLEAAEAVCSIDPIDVVDVLDLLASLVARSLVVATAVGADTRYRLLETIRQYGEERLSEAGETDTLRACHADFYIDFLGTVSSEIYGPGQLVWGARLASERDNLHAAMAFALDTQDVERAMGLLCALPYSATQIDDPVVFEPEAVLALSGATEHPGSALALMESAHIAARRLDFDLALELVERAFETERRLGPPPSTFPLDLRASLVREVAASASSGSLVGGMEHWETAAGQARTAGLFGLEASCLALHSWAMALFDPVAAAEQATESLALARRDGSPGAINVSLLALAFVLTEKEPDRAATLLREASSAGYENLTELGLTTLVAAQLGDWEATLRAASRLFRLDRRSGAIALSILARTFLFVARGLVAAQPETAAVLLGAARRLLPALVTSWANSEAYAGGPDPFETRGRLVRDTTGLIVEALGEERMRELLVQGEAMDRDQASAYARTHVDEYLATLAPEVT